MSYLFVNNQEIKNDSGNPIPSEIIHNGSSVSTSNPLPVEFSNASINIGAEVEISNDSGNPVPISGTISVDNFPAFPTVQTVRGVIELDSTSLIALENINADVTGTVSVDNFPAFPTVQTVSLDSSSREALENITAVVTFPAVQTISGTVSLDSGSLISLENVTVNVESSVEVSNFPAVQIVSLDSSSRNALEDINATVSGTVSVDNFPAFPSVQQVSGTVLLDSTSLSALENIAVTGSVDVNNTVSVSGSVTATVDNFPSVQTVSLDSSSRNALENITAVVTFPEVQQVSGTVLLDSTSLSALENITVTGTVSIDNFPAFPSIQEISGTVLLDSTSLSALENITVTGTVDVGNTVTVSGSVTATVDNFPSVQTVSLDSSSRNALENITAVVTFPDVQNISGTVLLDSTSLSALENITVTGTVDVGNTVTVSGSVTSTIDNFPSVQTVSLDSSSRNALENITAVVTFPDVQQVSGTVLLDSTSLSALENITVTGSVTATVDNFPAFPSVQQVSGTVILDSTSLSALENINAVINGTVSVDNFPAFPSVQQVSGTVLLDSTSLSALENITVSGTVSVDNFPAFPSVQTVSLDSSSRNALENITAVVTFPDVQQVSGTVLLDSTSLSALENITATVSGTVSIDNFPANQTVTISELPEVEIKNDSNNPISISRNTTQNSESNPIFVKGTSDTTFFNPTQLDAFGRLRVSEPYTLFDNSFRYGERLGNWNRKVTGTTTVSHNANQGLMDLTVGTNSGDEIIRETSRVFQYQPGKSLLVMNTFSMGTAQANVRMRVGYFGKENGIYVEREGSNLYIVKRTSVSGSVDNVRISQTIWNGDKLDGTGASGYNLGDMSKSQIFWSDIEWLGVGSVRCGFVIDGQFILAHTFHHANDIEGTYMTTATLPIRYEVTNTGTSSGATLKQICSTVISEGGYSAFSRSRTASTALGGKAASNIAYTPMISIRLKSNRTDAVVIPTQVSLYGLQQAAYKYALIRQPSTLTGASWVQMDSASSVEYDITSTAFSGGTIVKEGFFVGDTKGGTTDEDLIGRYNHSLQLTREIISADSTGDIFTLAILATTNNDQAVASLSWQEHT